MTESFDQCRYCGPGLRPDLFECIEARALDDIIVLPDESDQHSDHSRVRACAPKRHGELDAIFPLGVCQDARIRGTAAAAAGPSSPSATAAGMWPLGYAGSPSPSISAGIVSGPIRLTASLRLDHSPGWAAIRNSAGTAILARGPILPSVLAARPRTDPLPSARAADQSRQRGCGVGPKLGEVVRSVRSRELVRIFQAPGENVDHRWSRADLPESKRCLDSNARFIRQQLVQPRLGRPRASPDDPDRPNCLPSRVLIAILR